MSVLRNLRALAFPSIAIACCIFRSAPLSAETRADHMRALVVVGDEHDAWCVRQIGGAAVKVVAPFAADGEFTSSDYSRCNSRAQAVRHFSVYVARADTDCPRECFWRERLTRDNPRGQIHWIAARRGRAEHSRQLAAQQAIEVHRVLVAALPDHRQTFDANLATELNRIRRLRCEPISFVTVDRQP